MVKSIASSSLFTLLLELLLVLPPLIAILGFGKPPLSLFLLVESRGPTSPVFSPPSTVEELSIDLGMVPIVGAISTSKIEGLKLSISSIL